MGGLTVKLAGVTFDSTGSFDLLYALFWAAALLAFATAIALPRPVNPALRPISSNVTEAAKARTV